ncbi:hypothetical protein, partial [uncultured Duncaniella sp.]|uniref:hypothetical protein n=1 Tax=uncultured Duncaniella sp. TaxID=2768039 RepID=UPI0025B68FD1
STRILEYNIEGGVHTSERGVIASTVTPHKNSLLIPTIIILKEIQTVGGCDFFTMCNFPAFFVSLHP